MSLKECELFLGFVGSLIYSSWGHNAIRRHKTRDLGVRKATRKQRALLQYLDITVPARLTLDQASQLLDQATLDERYKSKFARWNIDKGRLHPELYPELGTAPSHFFSNAFIFGGIALIIWIKHEDILKFIFDSVRPMQVQF